MSETDDTTTTLLNPGVVPVVYSDQGHVLGAGETRARVALDDTTRAALARGDLVWQDSEKASSARRERKS